MHFELSSVLVETHHRRLREAAQDPPPKAALLVWALIRRSRQPAPVVKLPVREIERLAA